MGNTIFIKDRKVCVKPLRSRLEAHTKTKTTNDTKRLLKFHKIG